MQLIAFYMLYLQITSNKLPFVFARVILFSFSMDRRGLETICGKKRHPRTDR